MIYRFTDELKAVVGHRPRDKEREIREYVPHLRGPSNVLSIDDFDHVFHTILVITCYYYKLGSTEQS